ncbi:MAG: hypothetical protein WC024_10725 [Shewanella sp.]|jgi:type I restriction enzyme S subunit|uniref:hypothetical protein n=2 Tax=Shewanella TaxID=22 RepID=UPI0021DA555D|nr:MULTISPECIES: hypothetical protein [unclassified Shewanella]MCU8034736.1 hypothetical protein [Shewanella sp. SM71]MCU8096605.1 hypothetical protein [Shewanella sp. SM102]
MYTQKISPQDIFDRINADAYAPHFVEAMHRLESSQLNLSTLGNVVCKPINNSIRGVTGELNNTGSIIPMFRPADISGGEANVSSAPKLSADFESDHIKSRVYPGDLVLGIAGSVGVVGRVPKNIDFGNINGSSARISTGEDYRSAYLLSYLQSKYGQSAMLRFGVGSVQKHLNLEDLPKVVVLCPSELAQKYIGEKVRQAERLRAWAKGLQLQIKQQFASLVKEKPAASKFYRTSIADLEPYRINPSHYDPVVLSLLKRASSEGVKLEPISALLGNRKIAGGATPKGADYLESGVLFVRVQNVKPLALDLSDAVFIDADTNDQLSRSECQVDDIVLSITGYPGTASLVTEQDLPMNINQHSVRFNVKQGVDSAYVCAALNSEFLKLQVQRLSIGGTRDALDFPSVGNLLIPRFSEDIESAVAVSARHYIKAVQLSKLLIFVAKMLVEELIEGNISEAEMVSAQQALEAGDDSLDRALLERMTAEGIDGEGDPLFDDIDQLYDLLEQAKQALDADDTMAEA